MGNRALITCAPYQASNVCVYVHWNGGQESIQGFLDACKALRFRGPGNDHIYALARLTQVIGAFFSDGLSLGIGKVSQFSGIDNGTWIIGGDWEILGNRGGDGMQELSAEDLEKAAQIAQLCIDRVNCASGG